MNSKIRIFTLALMLISGCSSGSNITNTTTSNSNNVTPGLEIKFLVGSALHQFCEEAATKFNQTNPQLDDGTTFSLKCEAKGSGDVITEVISLAERLKDGSLPADDKQFPTLISVDGEVYHSQLIYQMEQIFPGENYIPEIVESPLLAYSPMVFMASADVAQSLRNQKDIYNTLVKTKNYQELDPNNPNLPIYYVHTAPTRSNSGLQTLIAQFTSVSGKNPEELTIDDIQNYQNQVQAIESKVTRYGVSTSSLAKDMVTNGPYWASLASVYEVNVIEANSQNTDNTVSYEAIYPQATFTSNMRGILPNASWVSDTEKAAAEQIIEYLRSPEVQKIATNLGLRPGVPGVELGAKFTPEFGVDPAAQYESLRPPSPNVVAVMLKSWREFAKKPSQVVIIVDSSGSMSAGKLTSVQNTLKNYIESLGPKEKIALIDFDSEVRNPVVVTGTPEGKAQGLEFVANLQVDGGTSLYDAILYGHNWLLTNFAAETINGIIVLTDGEDSGSLMSLEGLQEQLKKTDFSTDKRIALFTIGYGQEGEFNGEILQQIAQNNGGYYLQGDPITILNLMNDLQLEF